MRTNHRRLLVVQATDTTDVEMGRTAEFRDHFRRLLTDFRQKEVHWAEVDVLLDLMDKVGAAGVVSSLAHARFYVLQPLSLSTRLSRACPLAHHECAVVYRPHVSHWIKEVARLTSPSHLASRTMTACAPRL
jgi:hypothetical protein